MSGDRSGMRQVTMLAFPFPDRVIKKNPSGGGEYVAHPIVEQRIITVLGRPPSTSLVKEIRGFVAAKPPNPNGNSAKAKAGSPALEDAVVGVVLRMEATVDGELWFAEEAGDCEQPHNWDTDGARLKDAMSDAYKRCAMRLGVALHLWAREHFDLFDRLQKVDDEKAAAGGGS